MEREAPSTRSKMPSKLRAPAFGAAGSERKRQRLDDGASTAAASSTSSSRLNSAASVRGCSNSAAISSAATGSKPLFTVGSKKPGSRPPTSKPATRTVSKPTCKAAARPTVTSAANESQPAATKAKARTKRAAWDTKGQLGDLREEFEEFKHTYRRDIADKENQREKLVVEKTQEIVDLESRLKKELAHVRKEKEEGVHRLERMEREVKDLLSQVQLLTDEKDELTSNCRILQKEKTALRLTEKEQQLEIREQSALIQKLTDKNSELDCCLTATKASNKELVNDKRFHERERRKLHNTIQELKGNIRVFARVRPAVPVEGNQQHEIFSFPDPDHMKITMSKPATLNETTSLSETLKKGEKLDFSFDRVFNQGASQQDVFNEISQLVQSALDGYNVCIFAYGQTGSGKTYTMQGPEEMSQSTQGMIPRSIVQIFDTAESLRDLGWTFTMTASFLEIYNETIKDLLGQPGSDVKHEIKTATGEVIVTNLNIVDVTRPQQVGNLFERATKNRHVAETNCNAHSSRSHSVFTLKISGVNDITSETCVGTLNLVDLAGSERLKESKSAGDRLKETQSINTSLSTLGNVIMALAAKKSHIPYRDSKLTFLLQNSLGGNSKTLMFVNLSPNEEHFNETVSSLRFATKVNNCSIGTAKKSIK